MQLTDPQQKAISHAGRNLQLIACAGSGKTEVVARRVVHLLTPGREGTLAPRNIVAFTFTDKAAAELKERTITRARQALGDVTGLAETFGRSLRITADSRVPWLPKRPALPDLEALLRLIERERIRHGSLAWSDDIELCADSIYLELTGRKPEDLFPRVSVPQP